MKTTFIEKILPVFFIAGMLIIAPSCSDDTPTPDTKENLVLIHQGYATGAATKFELWAPEKLFTGFNTLFFVLYDSITGAPVTNAEIIVHPIMTMPAKSHSCPVEQPEWNPTRKMFTGAVLFTMPSGESGSWDMDVQISRTTTNPGDAVFPVEILPKNPPVSVSFTGADEAKYFLAYRFFEKAKVGVNDIEFIIFQSSGHGFVPTENVSIVMEPEMPSMDHGSPNNQNPILTAPGHYTGKVNFTMTGEWRLTLEISSGSTLLATKYFDLQVD